MSGHTPGPWTVEKTDSVYGSVDGGPVARVKLTGNACDAANAALIAAAPELLAALEAMVAHCEVMGHRNGGVEGYAAFDLARAAIAKARGAK